MNEERYNRLKWKLTTSIVKTVIELKGVIFGGGVRDIYRHNIHAINFYESKKLRELMNNNKNECVNKFYDDKSILEEYNGRFEIPKDLDIMLHHSKLEIFLTTIKKDFTLKRIFMRDPTLYIKNLNIESNKFVHHKYKLTPVSTKNVLESLRKQIFLPLHNDTDNELFKETTEFIKKLFTLSKNPLLEIDLLVSKEEDINNMSEPPFGNIDYECNALIMDNYGIRVSKMYKPYEIDIVKRHLYLERILKDILLKRAVIVNENIEFYRLNKLIQKNWTIVPLMKEFTMVNEKYTGHCLICHEDLELNHYKSDCCDARYHEKCLEVTFRQGIHSILNKNKCQLCRTDLYFTSYDYSKIYDLIKIKGEGAYIPEVINDGFSDLPDLISDTESVT